MAERTVVLSLPEADADRLWEIAAKAGMTPVQMVKHLIEDLTGGGSLDRDHREYAQEWFNQCGYFYKYEVRRFSVWAAQNDCLFGSFEALECVADLDDTIADLKALTDDPALLRDPDFDRESGEFREIIADNRRYLKELYDKYTEDLARLNEGCYPYRDPLPAQTFEEALDDLREHQRQMEAYKSGRLPDKAADAPGKEAAAV